MSVSTTSEIKKAGLTTGFFIFLSRFSWLIIFPLAFLTYHNLSGAVFVGDDYDQIVENRSVQGVGDWASLFSGSSFYGGGADLRGTYYKPLMSLVFAGLYRLFTTHPGPYHIILVFLCTLNAVAAFALFRFFFSTTLSLLGASLFLIHPMNSEVVAYISNFQDALYMFFGIIALVFALSRPLSAWWQGVALSLLLLASLLSKETGVVFLPMTAVLLWAQGGFSGRPRIVVLVSLTTVMAIYLYLRVFVAGLSNLHSHFTPMELAGFWTRLLNVPAVAAYYIKGFFYPWPLSLGQHWMVTEISWQDFGQPLVVVVLALGFGLLTARHFGRPGIAFLVWSILGVGIHSQFVPLDSTVADRWFYFPGLGFIGLVLFWLKDIQAVKNLKPLMNSVLLVTIFTFAAWSHLRAGQWQDEESLLKRDLSFQSESFSLMNQLGYIYFVREQNDLACPLFEKSVALAPKWWVNVSNLGACRFRQGRFEEAKFYFLGAIKNGNYHLAYENYARVLIFEKRWTEARLFLEEAIPVFPQGLVLPALLNELKQISGIK